MASRTPPRFVPTLTEVVKSSPQSAALRQTASSAASAECSAPRTSSTGRKVSRLVSLSVKRMPSR